MNSIEFFQLCAGKWLSQRTSHNLTAQKIEVGKSEVQMEIIASTDAEVINLCQKHQIDPNTSCGGLRIQWNGSVGQDEKKQIGATVVAIIPNTDNSNSGKLLQKTGNVGSYCLSNDDILTLITESEGFYTEERLWFASENLRQRTSIVKRGDNFSIASFCSEIRMGVTKK
mgnify:CR=1 FL=1